MAQKDSATPTNEGLDAQMRVHFAYAAFGRLKDYGASVLKEVATFYLIQSRQKLFFSESRGQN